MGGDGRDSRKRGRPKEDDGDLSDTTREVRRLQRQLEAADDGKASSGDDKGPSKGGQDKRRSARDAALETPLGDGKERGAVTGIKLGEFAPGARKRTTGFSVKGKDGKDRNFGQSLESLANRQDSDDEGRGATPAAPEGSFRRRDVAELSAAAGVDEKGRPKAQLGVDGKVWSFVEGPIGDDDDRGSSEEGGTKRKASELNSDAKPGKAKGKDKAKDKKKKGKDKKDKKSKKKKKKKAKAKKKKRKEASSSSSSSSSGSSS